MGTKRRKTANLDAPIIALPDIRFFKVRRFAPTPGNINTIEPGEWEEGIEAHRIEEHACGNLTFFRYLSAHPQESGGVSYTYKIEKLLAAGTYYDLIEVTEDFHPHTVN